MAYLTPAENLNFKKLTWILYYGLFQTLHSSLLTLHLSASRVTTVLSTINDHPLLNNIPRQITYPYNNLAPL
jgi:hypothetical protein